MRNEAVQKAGKTAGSPLVGILIGLIFIAIGIVWMFGMNHPHYGKTTGTITAVNGEDNQYTVTYTVDGKQYTKVFDISSSGLYRVGGKVKIYYDENYPASVTSGGTSRYSGIFFILGGICAFIVALSSRKAASRRQNAPEFPPITLIPKEEMDLYRVSNDGKMIKQGYKAWDSYGTLVYEWHPVKYVPFKGQTVSFTNHRTGRTSEHVWKSGGIESSTNSGKKIPVGFGTIENRRTTTIRWFDLDGRDLWDVFREKGISIRTQMEMESIPKVIFTVARDGYHFATIEIGGDEHYQELQEQGAGGGFHYKCWTAENDLDTLFLIVAILAATENDLPK